MVSNSNYILSSNPLITFILLDICLISEKIASKDQIARAKKYYLPDNFYLYETKPNCTGCRGCLSRED